MFHTVDVSTPHSLSENYLLSKMAPIIKGSPVSPFQDIIARLVNASSSIIVEQSDQEIFIPLCKATIRL